MNVTLIRIDAADASGTAVPLRLSSHDVPEACHLAGEQWEPALATLPDLALDFFGGAFAGQVTAPRAGFAVATIGLAAFAASAASRARFADARVRIWHGDITSPATVDLGPLTLRFDGQITGEPTIDEATRTARFEAAVQDSWADKPLLTLFAGTGGIEGPADLSGQAEPLVLGNARFCGGVLIDNVDNVWMVSDGPVQAVNAVYDRLTSLGASAGDFASLAALKAASIPNGSWGTCLALGLVRLGAPPDGRVSFDVSGSNSGTGGYVRLPGAIIRRIAARAGGTVNAASLTALDSARPYNLALQLREQVSPREAIGQIADSVAAVAGVSLTGQLFVQPLAIAPAANFVLLENGSRLLLESGSRLMTEASSVTGNVPIAADDTSEQRVIAVEELAKAAPAWRLATEAELTFEVHTASEAAFAYRWQGEYSSARVYRLDDVVTGPDGAAWAYVNAVPAAGQALPIWPTTASAFWALFQAPASASIAPANANRVPFSRMEGNKGWAVTRNPAPLAITTDYGATSAGARFVRGSATIAAAAQTFSIGNNTATAFRVAPGERLSVQARVSRQGASTGTWQLELWTYEANGTTGSATVIASGSAAINIADAIQSAFVTVPAGRVFVRLELRYTATTTGTAELALAEPMVTSAAAGQTVHPAFTRGPNADDGADISVFLSRPKSASFTYSSTGTLDPSAQLPADLTFLVSNQSGPITSGVTWFYRVVEGGVNGFTASETDRTMSVSAGVGTFTLSSLDSNTAQIEVFASFGGATISDFLTLTKVFAAPTAPPAGGPATVSQTSGFTNVTSTTFASVSNELQVTSTTTTQTVDVQLSFMPFGTTTGTTTIEVQVERWNGTAWVAMGAAVTAQSDQGFDSRINNYRRTPAVFNFQRTATITAGTNQRTRIRARRTAGTINHSVTGTLTLSA